MEITVEELNNLLQKEFERGRQAIAIGPNLRSWINNEQPWNTLDAIPEACKSCPNHPSNGGSGICNCILGNTVTYTTTTTNIS